MDTDACVHEYVCVCVVQRTTLDAILQVPFFFS